MTTIAYVPHTTHATARVVLAVVAAVLLLCGGLALGLAPAAHHQDVRTQFEAPSSTAP